MAFNMSPVLDELPDEIKFLAEPARRYNIRNGGDAIEGAVRTLSPEQINELQAVGKRVSEGQYYGNQVSHFLDKYDLATFNEAAMLYFFFGLLDELDVVFEKGPNE